MSDAPKLIVVGIGADGWAGLGEPARAALAAAEEVIGSRRQLELLPDLPARRRPWPSPIDPLLDEVVARAGRATAAGEATGDTAGETTGHTAGETTGHPAGEVTAGTAGKAGPSTCVLASGDPMLHGIGATLARRLGPDRLIVHPHISAVALVCARLGWGEAEVSLVSAVGRPPEALVRALAPGRKVVAYSTNAAALASVASAAGYGPSRFVVLEQVGGPAERILETTADTWGQREADPLHAVALECRADPWIRPLPLVPGLPDDAFESDGALTKRHVRAATLAALAPLPGQLLWDIGAGSGSVAIEWLRAEPTARAIALEAREDRAARAAANARRLGVPQLDVRIGRAPEALDALEQPDAVFLGGGLTTPGLVDRCWAVLSPGGRLVANAVTLEGEHVLFDARAAHGGELVRLDVAHAEPVGSFTAWRARLPIVQWEATK